MNCAECKELLVAHVEGLLGESENQAVAEHLGGCPDCRAEREAVGVLHQRLVSNGSSVARAELEDVVMNRIVREQSMQLRGVSNVNRVIRIGRMIMKNSIVKLAAAAVVVAAVLVGVHFIGNPMGATVTFAKVIQPILDAKNVVLDLVIGADEAGPVMHEIVVDQRIRRTISNLPDMVQIIDLDNGRMLALDTNGKTASYVSIEGELRDRTQSYVNFLRDIITKMKDNPNVEQLGEQIIDGRRAVGFTAKGPNEEVTIWAHARTAMPIRIYLRVGQMRAILKNFELNASVPDSLLSMDVPPGYTKKDTQLDLGNATEQDFVESLRVWAKVLGDGTFPNAIGTENAMKQMPILGQKLDELRLSEEQTTQMGMAFGRGMLFHQIIDTSGDDWHYAGNGVKLGDAEKAVFWYRPKDSPTYRVIYGDLHVADVAAENLPK